MGYKTVYRSLTELFPQIDARILKAVAIEHPKDANEAAAVVVSEIVPSFCPNSDDNSAQPGNKIPGTVPSKVERDMQKGELTGSETGAYSSGTISEGVDCDHETEASTTELLSNRNPMTNVMPNGDLNIPSKVKVGLEGLVESEVVSSDTPAFVQAGARLSSDGGQGGKFHIIGNQAGASTSAVSEDAVHKLVYPVDNSAITQKSSRIRFRFKRSKDVDEMVTSDGGQGGELYITGNQAEARTSTGSEDKRVNPVDNSATTQKLSRIRFRFGKLIDEDEVVISDCGKRGEFNITGDQAEASTNAVSEDAVHKLVYPVDNTATTQKSSQIHFRFGRLNDEDEMVISDGGKRGEFNITGGQTEASTAAVSEDAVHKLIYPVDNTATTQKSSRTRFRFRRVSDEDAMVISDGGKGCELNITRNQAQASTRAVSEDAVHKLVYPVDNLAITQKSSRSPFRFGSLSDEDEMVISDGGQGGEFHITGNQAEASTNSLTEAAVQALFRYANLSDEDEMANFVDETSNGSLVVENGDPELGGAFSSVVSRSTQGCNIGHLEQIIEDAKSNKRTLFTVMESIMNLMREVELQEKDAEKAKEDAARGGSDTLDKVEELKKMLSHAREANDMHAGEVYGERSILSTEVNELENRLLNLSEERDKSLSVLDEMRGSLETRLAAALEIKNAAEQEKLEKEGSARKALAEQEAIMEKVVQESKLLQQEAEENSKLRDFLMDHGRIVDSLQGEISVICQDIRYLKEKFDNRVPLSQSISSSQTSCKLASSGSSMRSLLLEKPSEASYETPGETSSNNKSPKALVNEEKDERKELLEDGWDIFDKETEL